MTAVLGADSKQAQEFVNHVCCVCLASVRVGRVVALLKEECQTPAGLCPALCA